MGLYCNHMIAALLGILFLMTSQVDCLSDAPDFDQAFLQFLGHNGYSGGALAAMKDGRLIYAKGYGLDKKGREVKANSHFPVSSLAKSLTAVAVLRLVQTGAITLEDQVFGEEGVLSHIKPYRGVQQPGLSSITVDHLLRHTAGWDLTVGPLYDPLLNGVYLHRGHDVPSIAAEMGLEAPVMPKELISYVMSLPLTFTPGTKVAYSNMAYLVLGRVVEAASGMPYRDYVKRFILDTCGMWSTRLEPSSTHHSEHSPPTKHYKREQPEQSSMYDLLTPVAVDSALGWTSNVYDIMRFSRCIFETQTVLDDSHMELLLAKPLSTPVHHDETWYCAGFRTNTRNIIWQDGDLHAPDLILYHDFNGRASSGSTAGRPDSWVVLLDNKNINHLRHHTRELMALLDSSDQDEMENLFAYDLSDLHQHPNWPDTRREPGRPEFTVRYQLDEHHLTAYVVALQDEGFNLQWFTTYSMRGHTYFLMVSTRVLEPAKDFVFEHGLSHRGLLKRKLQLEQAGYNMTQLHSYKSKSHRDPTSFAAVFRQGAFRSDTQMKYGTSHLPEPYQKLVQMYHEKQFYPISQSVLYQQKDEEFSFVYIKENVKKRIDFRQFYDLTVNQLNAATLDNAKLDLRLSYLNSYDVKGKFRFSAVFSNATHSRGLLELDQPQERATEITISNLASGLAPKYIVPYLNKDKRLRLAIYYQEEF